MSEQLSNEQINALVAEALGWRGRIEVSKARSLKSAKEWCVAFMERPGDSLGDYSHFVTRDGSKVYCGSPHRVHFPPRYTTDANHAREMEAEMERRGLRTAYIEALVGSVTGRFNRDGHCDCVDQSGACPACWWSVLHATPEQRCLAALAALEQQGEAAQ